MVELGGGVRGRRDGTLSKLNGGDLEIDYIEVGGDRT